MFEHAIPSLTLKSLYVGESYQTIASSIEPGINKAIITGTPGIGKSLFLIYFLWKLVKADQRVLLIYHPDTIYYDGQGGIFYCLENSLPSSNEINFWDDSLWCLFDAKGKKEEALSAFPYERCTFVLSTSPRR
jgi:Cdc6-like AAA superfamily ATPase